MYIVFKNEARHSNDSAIDKRVQVSRVFSIFKSFLSLFFPGRVESYIEESYVIDTAWVYEQFCIYAVTCRAFLCPFIWLYLLPNAK